MAETGFIEDETDARTRYYRKLAIQHEKRNIQAFKQQIVEGNYPEKCLECYQAGLNYCKFWNENFNCEPYEQALIIEQLKELGW